MKLRPPVIYIEFDSGTPIPPDQIVLLTQPDGWIVVKVAANQRQLDGAFTIRGRMVAINTTLMETKQIKEVLAGQGLSKQEIEIVLGTIKGVKVTPLAYSSLNDMAEEIVSLKEYKEKAQGAIAILGGATQEPKKARAPRSDKGTTKTETPPPTPEPVVKDEKPAAEKTDKVKSGAKKPTPRLSSGTKKESAEDIKDNVRSLGNTPPPPPGGDGPSEDNEDEIPL